MNKKLFLPLISIFALISCSSGSENVARANKHQVFDTNSFVLVGKSAPRTYLEYNQFSMYALRDEDDLTVIFESSKAELQRNGYVNLFLNTGETGSLGHGDYQFKLRYDETFSVLDYSMTSNVLNKAPYIYEVGDNGLKFTIPYKAVGLNSEDIIGLSFSEYLSTRNAYLPMIFDGVSNNTKDTSTYARLDNANFVFGNTVNEPNDLWISKADKERLVEGKEYYFALSQYQGEGADNIYFSIDRTQSDKMSFSFVGFGKFNEEEYIHMVLHNDVYNGVSWKTLVKDIQIIIDSNKVSLYKGENDYWNYEQDKLSNPAFKEFNVSYDEQRAYFTIDFDLDYEDVKEVVSRNYESFKLTAVEHADKMTPYNIDIEHNLYYRGVSCSDQAMQMNYALVPSGASRAVATAEEKAEIIGSRTISFAAPKDVGTIEGDDFYVGISKDEDSVNFDLVGFGVFNYYEHISLTLHQGEDTSDLWVIKQSDYHILISRNYILYRTGISDYFGFANFDCAGGSDVGTPITYTEHEKYFSLTFEIPFTVLSNFDMSQNIKGFLLEMAGGNVYNCEPWSRAMRNNGSPCGDPAYQNIAYQIFC